MRTNISKLTLVTLMLLPVQLLATTYTLNSEGTGDFATIQAALNEVTDGDVIQLEAGTYTGWANKNLDFLGKAVTLRSVLGDPTTCIIDCEGNGRGMKFFSNEGSDTLVRDLTIVNGVAPEGDISSFFSFGGGIAINGASPTIMNLRILSCRALDSGGGIYVNCALSGVTVISRCVIANGLAIDGGGIYVYQGVAIIERCLVTGCQGGGIKFVAGAPGHVVDNVISNNTYVGDGGGVYLCSGHDVVSGNSFINNSGHDGGGLHFRPSQSSVHDGPYIISNTFAGNTATGSGGGVYFQAGTSGYAHQYAISSCTFTDNMATVAGGALYVSCAGYNPSSMEFELTNSILYGDDAPIGEEIYLTGDDDSDLDFVINYCDVDGLLEGVQEGPGGGLSGGNGLFDANPQFVGGPWGNYCLGQLAWQPSSPCLNAGSDLAETVWVPGVLGDDVYMDVFSTATGQVGDTGVVDLGAHYRVRHPAAYWVTDHFPDIQTAIIHVGDADTVYVRPGVYPENIDFVGKDDILRSEFGAELTTIEGSSGSPVVTFDSGEGMGAVLQGFTIEGGYLAFGNGAGIYCEGASPQLLDNIITNNNATTGHGGGIYSLDGFPSISGNIITHNRAGDHQYHRSGGGIYVGRTFYTHTPSLDLSSNTIVENAASHGPAIFIQSQDVALDRNIVFDNDIPATGGQTVEIADGSSPEIEITCCDIYGNDGSDWGLDINAYLGIDGNINLDPLFCYASNENFYLTLSSPCAEENNATCGQIGALSAACNPTLVDISPSGESQFRTIQAGIDAVADGGVVELTDGVFTGEGNRDLDYRGKRVTVRSQSGDPTSCIIDCESQSRGIWFHSGEDAGAVLRGITIRNGLTTSGDGGAILCSGTASTPTITNCIFQDCSAADDGGAVGIGNGAIPTIADCSFIDNTCADRGGAIYISSAASNVTECHIAGSEAGNDGGAIYCLNATQTEFTSCTIVNNRSIDEGPGIYSWNSLVTMTECLIVDNVAEGQWGGAALATQGGVLTLDSCTLSGNSGVLAGGLIADSGAELNASNTIVAFGPLGAAAYCGSGAITLACCDLYGNVGGDYVGCISGMDGVDGNINADPLFCDAASGDYTIDWSSPCVPLNSDGCYLIGAEEPNCGEMQMADIIGLYADTEASQNWLRQDSPGTFTLYLIIQYPVGTGGIYTWECALPIPDFAMHLTAENLLGGVNALEPPNYSVTLGTPLPGALNVVVAELTYLTVYLQPSSFYLNAASPSSLDPPAPCYIAFDNTEEIRALLPSSGSVDVPVFYLNDPSYPNAVPEDETPTAFALDNCVPNPFNPQTTISYSLPESRQVRLCIFDLRGRLVTTLVDEMIPVGEHEVIWQGRDDAGRTVASGAYIYRLTAGDFQQTRSMALIK